MNTQLTPDYIKNVTDEIVKYACNTHAVSNLTSGDGKISPMSKEQEFPGLGKNLRDWLADYITEKPVDQRLTAEEKQGLMSMAKSYIVGYRDCLEWMRGKVRSNRKS